MAEFHLKRNLRGRFLIAGTLSESEQLWSTKVSLGFLNCSSSESLARLKNLSGPSPPVPAGVAVATVAGHTSASIGTSPTTPASKSSCGRAGTVSSIDNSANLFWWTTELGVPTALTLASNRTPRGLWSLDTTHRPQEGRTNGPLSEELATESTLRIRRGGPGLVASPTRQPNQPHSRS